MEWALPNLRTQSEHRSRLHQVQDWCSHSEAGGEKRPIGWQGGHLNSGEDDVMAFDMVFAGIDTTGNKLSFLVSHLSRNQDKQEKLRQEIQRFGQSNLTVQDLGQMPYFKACLQESFRMTPIANMMARIVPQDSIIGGYKVPAGDINLLTCFILAIRHSSPPVVNFLNMQVFCRFP